MSAAVPFFLTPHSAALLFLYTKKKRERWLLPCLQLGVFLFMRVSFLPLVFNPLVSPVFWCWSQIVKQAAPSKRRQALWLLLSQSHISLFRLLVHIRACVCGLARVYTCVSFFAVVCFEVVCDISLAVTGNDLIFSMVTRDIHKELPTHTRTHTKRVKSGSRDWYCNGTLMGYLTSAFS